jgi:hypothetical protein
MRVMIAALLLNWSLIAVAQQQTFAPGSAGANFNDDAILSLATLEISNMQRHEIDLLTDAVATCRITSLAEEEILRRQCEVARERYLVGYGDARPVDELLLSIRVVNNLIRLQGRGYPGEQIQRLVSVESRLARAISERNRQLRAQSMPASAQGPFYLRPQPAKK